MPDRDLLSLRVTPRRHATITVPGSKSLTNRALAVAALADGTSTVTGALVAEDRDVMCAGLRNLGIGVLERGTTVHVDGKGGAIPSTDAALDLRLSGTAIRFLAAIASLGTGTYRLDGTHRMRERPIEDLLVALRTLGVDARSDRDNGCPPATLVSRGWRGGDVRVAGDRSSQFLSALLMAAPAAGAPVTISIDGVLQSKPFVDMTLGVMQSFGVQVQRDGYDRFHVVPARYEARTFAVEGDAMAAGYFWAWAAVTGSTVVTPGIGRNGMQGDARLADVLGRMGCNVVWADDSVTVTGPATGRLAGGTFDLNDMPDQAQTLAAVAVFAEAPVRIENVWNMRIKETDRLSAMTQELRTLGVHVDEENDAMTVHPLGEADLLEDAVDAVELDTYGDHRMAMSLAVVASRRPRVSVRDPGCVAKTYPAFWDAWASLGGVDGGSRG